MFDQTQWEDAGAAYRARHASVRWGADGPLDQQAWEKFHRYYEGWRKVAKDKTMTYIVSHDQGTSVAINIERMVFIKRTMSKEQSELWSAILYPGEQFRTFDLSLRRNYAAMSERELLLLYQNTAGKPCAPGDYSRIILLCAEMGWALLTDHTGVSELKRKLGIDERPSVPADAPWLDDSNPTVALASVAAEMPRPAPPKAPAAPKVPHAPNTTIKAPKQGGACAQVWEIAEAFLAAKGRTVLDTKDFKGTVINACVEKGINKSTAGVQFGKWRQTK